jgi:hypothetical protein
VEAALASFGALLKGVSAEDFVKPDLIFQIGVAPRRIDLLTGVDGLEFASAVAHGILIQIDGIPVTVLSREDLLKNKRASGRPKDLADVAWLEEQERA